MLSNTVHNFTGKMQLLKKMNYLIKNAAIVNELAIEYGDVFIKNGRIEKKETLFTQKKMRKK